MSNFASDSDDGHSVVDIVGTDSEDATYVGISTSSIAKDPCSDTDISECNQLRSKINLRERKRMHDLNIAMDSLREVMPYANGPSVRKISKIATLSLARNYIESLKKSLDDMKQLLDEVYRSGPQGQNGFHRGVPNHFSGIYGNLHHVTMMPGAAPYGIPYHRSTRMPPGPPLQGYQGPPCTGTGCAFGVIQSQGPLSRHTTGTSENINAELVYYPVHKNTGSHM